MLESELTLADQTEILLLSVQLMRETEFGLSAKFKLFKDFSLYRRSTSFERSSSSFNLAVHKKGLFKTNNTLNKVKIPYEIKSPLTYFFFDFQGKTKGKVFPVLAKLIPQKNLELKCCLIIMTMEAK